jgi:F0F1-type ATP synthase assembly protein I
VEPDDRPGRDGSGRTVPRWVRYGRGTAIVFEFVGTIGAGAVIGYFLDRYFGTEPTLQIVMTVLAVIGGFVRLLQMLRRFEQGSGM